MQGGGGDEDGRRGALLPAEVVGGWLGAGYSVPYCCSAASIPPILWAQRSFRCPLPLCVAAPVSAGGKGCEEVLLRRAWLSTKTEGGAASEHGQYRSSDCGGKPTVRYWGQRCHKQGQRGARQTAKEGWPANGRGLGGRGR